MPVPRSMLGEWTLFIMTLSRSSAVWEENTVVSLYRCMGHQCAVYTLDQPRYGLRQIDNLWVCLNDHVMDTDNKEDQEADKDGEVGEVVKKRVRRGMKASTTVVIEECPSVLDITNFETEFRVDPLFQKTSAAFDEGGVSGLLLNNIDVR